MIREQVRRPRWGITVAKRQPEQEYELLNWDSMTRGAALSSASQERQRYLRAKNMAAWGMDHQLAFIPVTEFMLIFVILMIYLLILLIFIFHSYHLLNNDSVSGF